MFTFRKYQLNIRLKTFQVLNDENVWAPSSSPIPSAQPDFSPTCKSGFDECSIADLSQPECDSGTCTAEMMKNGVNPCELTGTFKGKINRQILKQISNLN